MSKLNSRSQGIKSIKESNEVDTKSKVTTKLTAIDDKIAKKKISTKPSERPKIEKKLPTATSAVSKKIIGNKNVSDELNRLPKRNATVAKDPKIVSKVKSSTTVVNSKKPTTISTKPAIKSNPSKLIKTEPKPNNVSKRQAPLRASHSVISIAKPSIVTVSPNNVMNKVHNVTVSSPPSVRRDITSEVEAPSETEEISITRDRTRTRTLDKSEIILLKSNEHNVPIVLDKPKSVNVPANNTVPVQQINVEIKQPISFEVNFDDNRNEKTIHNQQKLERSPQPDEIANKSDENDDDSYADDFESYESDFEADISSNGNNSSDEKLPSSRASTSSESSDEEPNIQSGDVKHPFEPKKIDDEHELDSGSFELKVLSTKAHSTEHPDSVPQIEKYSEIQNDSGIEYFSTTCGGQNQNLASGIGGTLNSLDAANKTCDNISDIEIESSLDTSTNPKRNEVFATKMQSKNRRGEELLKKITLDTMSYVLYDFKPIPYDLFMKIYGTSNTTQVSVQTHNNRVDQDTQNDVIVFENAWVQCPPTFYTKHMLNSDFLNYRNGCSGRIQYEIHSTNMFNNCLNRINSYSTESNITDEYKAFAKQLNYDSLNRFLMAKEITISRLIEQNLSGHQKNWHKPTLPMSKGYFAINFNSNTILNQMIIYKIFASEALPSFLFTLHKESVGQLHLIAIWNLGHAEEPVCLLSSWSSVQCIEIHSSIRDVVFAGLGDGSLAVWNYVESQYWHPSLDNANKRFVPSQIVTPILENSSNLINSDVGKVVAIRSLYVTIDFDLLNGYNPKQICSLHDCGLLILWSILETTTSTAAELTTKRIDHQSVWSKLKLAQNKIIDLRPSVDSMYRLRNMRPTSSSFEKTRSYFESDLFSDVALQELQAANQNDTKHLTIFNCTALELTHDAILIATNENILLFGRKSFKNENFQRLQIDQNQNARIETMIALNSFEDDMVLAAFNDGSIRSFCYNRNAWKFDRIGGCDGDGEEPSISSVSSLPPMLQSNTIWSASNTSAPASASSAAGGGVSVPTTNGLDNGAAMGKSCIIQSIVQGERKLYNDIQALNNLDTNECKAELRSDGDGQNTQRIHKFTNFVNDQMILNNSQNYFTKSKRQLVQLIKTNKLVTLHRNQLRFYDLISNETIDVAPTNDGNAKCVGIATTVGDNNVEYLILYNENNITVHVMTNERI